MKTIGLLGGMSWESTIHYYRLINERVRERLGGLHSAPILLHSFDFETIRKMQQEGRWEDATQTLTSAARGLERAGAECVAICTNTMHLLAEEVQRGVSVPLLHIADAAGGALRTAHISRVLLLGTRYTMQESFLRDRLQERSHLEVITPTADEQEFVHRVIFEELCRGVVRDSSRERLAQFVDSSGAEAALLACTELMLLLRPQDCRTPIFDTTALHALALADWSLGERAVAPTQGKTVLAV